VGLSVILGFVGTKMLITFFDIHVPIGLSLGIIGGILVASIVASLIWPKAAKEHLPAPPPRDREGANP
jgi:tellurite resistance protein TerC